MRPVANPPEPHRIGAAVFDLQVGATDGPLGSAETLTRSVRLELLSAVEAAHDEVARRGFQATLPQLALTLPPYPADPDWAEVRRDLEARLIEAILEASGAQPGSVPTPRPQSEVDEDRPSQTTARPEEDMPGAPVQPPASYPSLQGKPATPAHEAPGPPHGAGVNQPSTVAPPQQSDTGSGRTPPQPPTATFAPDAIPHPRPTLHPSAPTRGG